MHSPKLGPVQTTLRDVPVMDWSGLGLEGVVIIIKKNDRIPRRSFQDRMLYLARL